jgi:hypothetical protein
VSGLLAAVCSSATARCTPRSSHVPELVIAGVLFLLGVRSLVHWLRVEFPAESASEHVLFALHVTARVGTWFGLAAAFLGYALVPEPQRYRWFLAVILVLGGIQLLTAASLGLQPGQDRRARDEDRAEG